MKTNKKFGFLMMLLTFASSLAIAQTTEKACENPRGFYKLDYIIGKDLEVFIAPYPQYKICTDDVTFHLVITNESTGSHSFFINDNQKFNYTGETPDGNDPTASRIYDSNAEGFTLKWWSNYSNHKIFPENDWCIEHYSSDGYSPTGKILADAIMQPQRYDKRNPLIGAWLVRGKVDELKQTKKQLQKLDETNAVGSIVVFTPEHFVQINQNVSEVKYEGKKSFTYKASGKKVTKTIHKVSNTIYAIETANGIGTDYILLERIPDDVPPVRYYKEMQRGLWNNVDISEYEGIRLN